MRIKRTVKSFLGLALAVGVTVALAGPANAVGPLSTWDFAGLAPSGTPAELGPSAVFAADDASLLTASGHLQGTEASAGVNQDVNGLGVTGSCITNNDINECAGAEYLQFAFGSAQWVPISITLTRLESLKPAGEGDDWKIFGNTSATLVGATELASGAGGVSPQLITFSGTTPFQFIFAVPTVAGLSFQSDFRVSQVVGDVPEPATLLLLGTGLVGLAGVARRRR